MSFPGIPIISSRRGGDRLATEIGDCICSILLTTDSVRRIRVSSPSRAVFYVLLSVCMVNCRHCVVIVVSIENPRIVFPLWIVVMDVFVE